MGRYAVIFIAVLVFVGIVYFLFRDDLMGAATKPEPTRISRADVEEPEPQPIAPSPAPTPVAERDETPAVPAESSTAQETRLPPLPESDDFVRDELERFGLPAAWTIQDGLVRRFAVLADAVTRGEWPHRPLRFLKPPGRFDVIEREGRLFADPRNTSRFDAELDLLESIDPVAAARFLDLIEPLLGSAVRELGLDADGRATLLGAIDAVLETPVMPGEFELVRPKVLYEYADPALETLPPFEKQLMRIGPKNADRLKRYLLRLRVELVGLSD